MLKQRNKIFEETETDPKDWYVSDFDLVANQRSTNYISNPKYECNSQEGKCHLCGTSISNYYYINHDEKKLSCLIGSECIKKFLVAAQKNHVLDKIKRLTSKESGRKLKLRIYYMLMESLVPLFEAYDRALEFGMPEVNEQWHRLLYYASDSKLSKCANYAYVRHESIKDLRFDLDEANKVPFFEKIVQPSEWYDLNMERKKPMKFADFLPAMHAFMSYCKGKDDEHSMIKVFACTYMYRFSYVRKQCEISKEEAAKIAESKEEEEEETAWL